MDKTPAAPIVLSDRDKNAIQAAVFGLYAMGRIAAQTLGDLSIEECEKNGADTYLTAIRDLCKAYGRDLDDCLERLTHDRAGIFDPEDDDEQLEVPT